MVENLIYLLIEVDSAYIYEPVVFLYCSYTRFTFSQSTRMNCHYKTHASFVCFVPCLHSEG